MLTSDLAISFKRKGKIHPRLIKTNNPDYLIDAENLIAIFEEFENKSRGELENELEEYVGTGTNYRILRGFIKLLMDRCEFETVSIADPIEIRQKVFLEAKNFQPVLPESKEKEKVLEKVADEFETDPETILGTLFSDLPNQQSLTIFESITPEELLDRYNLAQAQALLYKCVEMKINILPSDPANYRAIFQAIKHFGLIHSIAGNAKKGYQVTITGAASLFHRSQKYGIQMAVFLPALLLSGDWEMSAEIYDKKYGNAIYELSGKQDELNSCYYDEPEFENPLYEKLITSWEKSSTEWTLEKNKEVIDLGKTAFIPDFVLTSPDKKEKVYLDILGFWTPKLIKKRLTQFEGTNFTNFILAASQELRGTREEETSSSPNLVFFKSVIRPLLLEETAENLLQ
jgi:predicted nuclease of restriction endonuclease-like RecB superfamily